MRIKLILDLFAYHKIQEQAPVLTEAGLLTVNGADLLMNLGRFNRLSKNFRRILIETGKEIEIRMGQLEIKKWTDKVLDAFNKQNVSVEQFPTAEKAKWASKVEDTPAKWAAEVAKQGYPG